MTQEEADRRYEELTYDLAKTVGKLSDICESMKYINQQMDYDGAFEIDFEDALAKLASVQASAVIYTFEAKYRNRDIKRLKDEVDALENLENIDKI